MRRIIRFAAPPMLARRLRQEIETAFPEYELSPPFTHLEMYEAARTFGETGNQDADLEISAYPQMLERIWLEGVTASDASGLESPPLRREWVDLGMTPPVTTVRIVAVVPLVLAVSARYLPDVGDWDDLAPLLEQGVEIGVPPDDTPLPFLLATILGARWGCPASEVFSRFDRASPPLDINKRLSRGDLAIGVLPPAFCRNFREGDISLVWPKSGAFAVPMIAALSPDAPPGAKRVLDYLLSSKMQRIFAGDGGLAPASEGVSGFAELDAARWRMQWPGWKAFVDVGRAMTAHLAGKPAFDLVS